MTSTGAPMQLQARDAELLARAQQGDVAAFEQLAGPHVNRLFTAVRRLVGDGAEAEDVVQETLLRAWRGIGGFRGRSSFFSWAFRIAVNESNRSLEKGARRPDTVLLTEEQLQVSSPPDDGPERRTEYREFCLALRMALLALPLPYRTAVVLRDIEGFSTREAAEIVGVREATFKSRLHEARVKLRATLGDDVLISAAG